MGEKGLGGREPHLPIDSEKRRGKWEKTVHSVGNEKIFPASPGRGWRRREDKLSSAKREMPGGGGSPIQARKEGNRDTTPTCNP